MNGKTLGHYHVGEQLGRGGMGEVCAADDLDLNHKVALKFLPDAVAGDTERMARFERDTSVSRLVGETLREKIPEERRYEAAMQQPFAVCK